MKRSKRITKKKLQLVDVRPLSEMTREELEAHIGRLRQELERERAERNRWQIEKDKVTTFWKIAKHQLEERNAELRAAQATTEEVAERRERELAAYRLRIRHLQSTHASDLAEVKAEMATAIGLAVQEAKANCRDPRIVEELVRKEQADHDALVKQMRLDHEKQVRYISTISFSQF